MDQSRKETASLPDSAQLMDYLRQEIGRRRLQAKPLEAYEIFDGVHRRDMGSFHGWRVRDPEFEGLVAGRRLERRYGSSRHPVF